MSPSYRQAQCWGQPASSYKTPDKLKPDGPLGSNNTSSFFFFITDKTVTIFSQSSFSFCLAHMSGCRLLDRSLKNILWHCALCCWERGWYLTRTNTIIRLTLAVRKLTLKPLNKSLSTYLLDTYLSGGWIVLSSPRTTGPWRLQPSSEKIYPIHTHYYIFFSIRASCYVSRLFVFDKSWVTSIETFTSHRLTWSW